MYAVQATGNGHISRAKEILPYLKKYGQTDVFLSGSNHDLSLGAMDNQVRFRSRGLSLYYNEKGGLHPGKTIGGMRPATMVREILSLPVHRYDAVINDFDFITARACAWRNVPSVCFGHHASFISDKTPRPDKRNRLGELILKNFGRATGYVGLHFEEYDHFIHTPVIKKKILEAEPVNKGHITVYLPACSADFLTEKLMEIAGIRFEIFSKEIAEKRVIKNCSLYPAGDAYFTGSMITSAGIISGGGFETPAEALHLGKKLLVIPIRGQYEQACNTAALSAKGIRSLSVVGEDFSREVGDWLGSAKPVKADYRDHIPYLLEYIFDTYPYYRKKNSAAGRRPAASQLPAG